MPAVHSECVLLVNAIDPARLLESPNCASSHSNSNTTLRPSPSDPHLGQDVRIPPPYGVPRQTKAGHAHERHGNRLIQPHSRPSEIIDKQPRRGAQPHDHKCEVCRPSGPYGTEIPQSLTDSPARPGALEHDA